MHIKNMSAPLVAVCLLSAVLCPVSLAAMEAISPPYIISSSVDELAFLSDKHDGYYVIYSQDGRLSILRGSPGEPMTPYIPEWYGRIITDVHSLEYSPMGPGQYCAFFATENGAESVYLLKVNHEGELVFYRDPANGDAEGISAYAMIGADQETASLFYLQESTLFVSTCPVDPAGQWSATRVSLDDENVIAFGQEKIFTEKAGSHFLGWYAIEMPDAGNELVVFRSDGAAVSLRRKLTAFEPASRVVVESPMTGKNRFSIIEGARIKTVNATDEGFTDGLDISAPNMVTSFLDLGFISPGKAFVVCDEGAGKENAYLIDISSSDGGGPILVQLTDQPYDGGAAFMLNSVSELLVAYRSAEKAFVSVLDLHTGEVSTTELAACSSDSSLIPAGPSDSPRIILLDGESPANKVLYAFDGDLWASCREYEFDSIGVACLGALSRTDTEKYNRLLMDDEYAVLGFTNGTVLIGSNSIDSISYIKHAVNVFNGIDLLAAATADQLLIYKIGE